MLLESILNRLIMLVALIVEMILLFSGIFSMMLNNLFALTKVRIKATGIAKEKTRCFCLRKKVVIKIISSIIIR